MRKIIIAGNWKCPVADQGVGAHGAAMVQIEQNLQTHPDNVMRLAAFDVGHEADAARVMFIPGVVQTLSRWKSHPKIPSCKHAKTPALQPLEASNSGDLRGIYPKAPASVDRARVRRTIRQEIA